MLFLGFERKLGLLDKAKKELIIADHMLNVTFPLVKEKTLILSSLEHVDSAMNLMIKAFLEREEKLKKIVRLPKNETFLINFFTKEYEKKLDLNKRTLEAITLLPKLVEAKNRKQYKFELSTKSESFGFQRINNYFIIKEGFGTRKIEFEKIKEFLDEAKKLYKKISTCLDKTDWMF